MSFAEVGISTGIILSADLIFLCCQFAIGNRSNYKLLILLYTNVAHKRDHDTVFIGNCQQFSRQDMLTLTKGIINA